MILDGIALLLKAVVESDYHVMLCSVTFFACAVEGFVVFADDLEEQTWSQRKVWQATPNELENNLKASKG